jgi:hypothetical protein
MPSPPGGEVTERMPLAEQVSDKREGVESPESWNNLLKVSVAEALAPAPTPVPSSAAKTEAVVGDASTSPNDADAVEDGGD